MNKISAGLLMYRFVNKELQVFLVHPGGPFWKNNDKVWGIPKGLVEDDDLFETAKREFREETSFAGAALAKLNFVDLGFIVYPNGKKVYAWAFEGDLPNNFELKSNLTPQGWPEVDKGEFFTIEEAKQKIFPPQFELVMRLKDNLNL